MLPHAIGQTALMHRTRVALAVLASASLIAVGCGSDDAEPNAETQPNAAPATNGEPKPKKSVRMQMVGCIEDELGYEVTTDDGPHNLSLKSPDGKLEGVVIVHDDAAAARKAVDRTLGGGRNAVVFGRAEFIRHAADDTEAGVIANCVALAYNRPRG